MIAMAVPEFATISYSADYPVWRQVTFVVVNAGFAWLSLSRLIWLYAVLTIEVILKLSGFWQPRTRKPSKRCPGEREVRFWEVVDHSSI